MRVRCRRKPSTCSGISAVGSRLDATSHQREAPRAYVAEIRSGSETRSESTSDHYASALARHAPEHRQ
jgi:hypothetical protein